MLKTILDPESFQLHENAVEFSRAFLSGGAEMIDRDAVFSAHLWSLLSDAGYTTLVLPKQNGGEGISMTSACAVVHGLALNTKDNGLLFSLCAHLFAGLAPLTKFSNAQTLGFSEAISKNAIISNAMTEPHGGSDAFSMRSRGRVVESGFEIEASKNFITNAPIATHALVFVSTDETKGALGGISCILVNNKQFVASSPQSTMGLRTSPISEFFVSSVVSSNQIINSLGSGFMIFQYAMEMERVGIAAMHLGTMGQLLTDCIRFSKEHFSQGRSLISHQAISHRLAEMKVKLDASTLMVYHAAELLDKGQSLASYSSEVKLFVSEALLFCAQSALQIRAGNGYSTGWIERFLRDAHAASIYSGTSEIQKNIIAAYL